MFWNLCRSGIEARESAIQNPESKKNSWISYMGKILKDWRTVTLNMAEHWINLLQS